MVAWTYVWAADLPTGAAEPADIRAIKSVVASQGTARDAALQGAIKQSDALEDESRFSEVIQTHEQWEALAAPEVDFRLAYAYFRLALDDRAPSNVDLAKLDKTVVFAGRAAEAGHGPSTNRPYLIFANGHGRPVDMDVAMSWLKRGVTLGDLAARINFASMLYDGNAWVKSDRGRACRMFSEFADVEGAGSVSLYYLGLATLRGECGFETNPRKAADWIRRAAEGGVPGAARDYARLLENGIGGEVDVPRALTWYEQADERGDAYSTWQVGRAYAEGEGRTVDPVRAVEHFQRAADQGNGEAIVSLAVMHATGAGVPRDPIKASSLYRQAATAGQGHA